MPLDGLCGGGGGVKGGGRWIATWMKRRSEVVEAGSSAALPFRSLLFRF